jgi:hypothetical protein
MSKWGTLVLYAGLIACSRHTTGDDAGTAGPVVGEFDGVPFEAADFGAASAGATDGGGVPSVQLMVTEAPGACSALRSNMAQPGSRVLDVFVTNAMDQTAIGPGTYLTPADNAAAGDAPPSPFALILWHDERDGCLVERVGRTLTGSITLTDVTTTRIRGSLHATLSGVDGGAGGQVSGSFDAPICAADGGLVDAGCTL